MLESVFRQAFPRTSAVFDQGVERGLHTGAQIYVSRDRVSLADVGLGTSRHGVPMTPETINLWLSSGKPLTAVAILLAWERGQLRLDDLVTRFLPEFGQQGKGQITVRHLLTHTGGFRTAETGWPDVEWQESIERICAASLEADWVVGRTAGYHTASSWFVLGEILQRIEGRSYADILTDRLLQPLQMNDTWAAMPVEQHRLYGQRIGGIYARDQAELRLLDWDAAERVATPSPAVTHGGQFANLGSFTRCC